MAHVSPPSSNTSSLPCALSANDWITDTWCHHPNCIHTRCLGFPSSFNGICVPVNSKPTTHVLWGLFPAQIFKDFPLQCSSLSFLAFLPMSSVSLAYKHILVSSILQKKIHLTLRPLYSTEVFLVKMIKILTPHSSYTIAFATVNYHFLPFLASPPPLCVHSQPRCSTNPFV